jgi:SAM-dependent methyltransferase
MTQNIKEYIQFGRQLLDGSRTNHELTLANRRQEDIAPYLNGNQPLRVLDLANGRLRPQYLLLKAAGHHVYGIDLANRPGRNWVSAAYRIACWLYALRLGLGRLPNKCRTLICGDVANLPFPDGSFDLVTSVAAFEHFYHVPIVVGEIRRVLCPGGIAWVCIHLFTSPSGGHNVSLTEVPLRTIPAGVDPWDHLRRRRLAFHVSLNEWRKHQYVEAFERDLQMLKHYCVMREGEHLLTPEIEAELSAYSRDELTCGAYVIVARKTL